MVIEHRKNNELTVVYLLFLLTLPNESPNQLRIVDKMTKKNNST